MTVVFSLGLGVAGLLWAGGGPDEAMAHCRDGTPACPDVIIEGTTITIMDPTHTTVIRLTNQTPGVVLPLPAPTTPSLAPPLAGLPQPPTLAPPAVGQPSRPGQLLDVTPPEPQRPELASTTRPEPPGAIGLVPPTDLPRFEVDRGQREPPRPEQAGPPVALVPLGPSGAPVETGPPAAKPNDPQKSAGEQRTTPK